MIVFNLYRGRKPYTYIQHSKSKLVKNPISGHSWYEHTPLNKWDVISPLCGTIDTVRSEERAQELCAEYGSCNVYMPLTERELEKMRHELES